MGVVEKVPQMSSEINRYVFFSKVTSEPQKYFIIPREIDFAESAKLLEDKAHLTKFWY